MHNRCYVPGLDGIRAFAILFVTFYHFRFSWAKGGFLGVDIFFVLSGYLITSKILLSNKNFKVKTFWKGRLRRLLPPLYLMIIVTVLWVVLFNHRLLKNLLGDTLSSISYTTNWWFIFHKLSYFDSFGSPSPFKHLWFLAVQEQFYIIWPFILITVLKITKKINKLSNIIFIGALISVTFMAILYNPTADPSRVYYGTDTRAFELLIGSFLATIMLNLKPITKEASIKYKTSLNIISIITFFIFILSAVFIDEFNAFLYRGGLFLFSLNTALLIACICHPKGILFPILSWKPLRWIGTRSYGIYLWHYPIMILSTPVYEIGHPLYSRVFLQLALTCIIAEFSYRFIELPLKKFGFRKYYFEGRSLNLSTIVSFIVIISLNVGIISITKAKLNSQKCEASSPGISKTQISKKTMSDSSKNNDTNSNKQNSVISNKNNKENSPEITKRYTNILAIGDSIMLDIAPNLNKKYNNITINGKIGRQMWQAISLAPNYTTFNASDKAVIIQLGTNGYFTNKQIDELLNYFSKSHIFLVNVRASCSWESKVNKILKEKSEERDNITLIDWYSLSSKNPEYFEPDGVHLNPKGSEALVNFISEKLKQ